MSGRASPPSSPPRALGDPVTLSIGGVAVEGEITAVFAPVGESPRYLVAIPSPGAPDGVREVRVPGEASFASPGGAS